MCTHNFSCRAPILAAFSTYQETTAEIISVCETVASIVSPVVCNSSPEGFLPETAPQLEASQVRVCSDSPPPPDEVKIGDICRAPADRKSVV